MVEPGNTPDLHEIYRLVRENNHMLHSMRRRAFWGGIIKLLIYLAALAIPVWLYFTYLSPIIKQMDDMLTSANGKKVQLEGQFGQFSQMLEQLQEKFGKAAASSSSSH